jgi:serine/threonine protein kinase
LDNTVPREPRTAPPRETRATRPIVAGPKVSSISRPAIREVAIGDVLRGRYRVRGVVGHGGMGTVFEATDEYRVDLPSTGRRLAVKVLHTAVTQREELLAELQREFQHLQLLSHPNIVRVHEFDRDGDLAFFTMELLSGGLLSLVLQARNGIALPRRYALAVIRDAGAALSHAHSRGVIHGDINPQNIFITHDGELRVLDFGASHNLLPERWTADNAVALRAPVATPGYASCQQLEGQEPDVRDDLFAFACVVYVLLSGQHPFPKRTAIEARAQRLRPRRPPGLSGQQWRVLREGLRWDRERRPSNVQEWLDRFGLGGAAPRLPVMPVLVNTTPPRSHVPMRAAASFILFALLAAGGYWAFTNYDSLARDFNSLARNFTEWRNQASAPRTAEVPAANAPESLPAPNTPAPAAAAPPPAARSAPVGKTSPAAKPTAATPKPAVVAAPASAAAPTSAASHAPAAASDRVAAVRAGNAGPVRVEMAADTVDVSSDERTAHISVRRRGNIHGVASFKWWTESGTAKPGVDFTPVLPRVATIPDGSGSIGLDIPVFATRRSPSKSFYVAIDQSDDSGATLGSRALTMVTLLPPE